jgi:hypothetical protein
MVQPFFFLNNFEKQGTDAIPHCSVIWKTGVAVRMVNPDNRRHRISNTAFWISLRPPPTRTRHGAWTMRCTIASPTPVAEKQ